MKVLGVALEDAGHEVEMGPSVAPDQPEPGKKEIRYPTLYINDEELPAIKSKDFKDDCVLVAVVHVSRREESESEGKDGKKKTRISATLEFRNAAFVPYGGKKPSPDEMSDMDLDDAIAGKKVYAKEDKD